MEIFSSETIPKKCDFCNNDATHFLSFVWFWFFDKGWIQRFVCRNHYLKYHKGLYKLNRSTGEFKFLED